MEAKQNFTKNSIEVTATREEWIEILRTLDIPEVWGRSIEAIELFEALEKLGVEVD